MCGITGCLALADGAGPDTEWVGRAAMRVAHRGPDDEAFFADQHLALGFRRLAVIDTSAAGRQPMQSADGRFVLVFDGEIYNYAELAQRLHARGVRLRSRSAAEVLLEMYAWLGKDVVRQLRGMYAFAIWDRRNLELFCARDPFGIKPFFYALTTGGHRPRSGPQLRFASERKALAGPGEVTDHRPGRAAPLPVVPVRARAGHPGPARPGPAARARADRPAGRPGRRVPVLAARAAARPGPRRRARRDKILDVMRDSIAVHLRSDVPVGAFLSGGIDSATHLRARRRDRPDLLTFTVGFDREGYSEIDRRAGDRDRDRGEVGPLPDRPGGVLPCLPRIIWHLDDPMADAAAIPLWFVGPGGPQARQGGAVRRGRRRAVRRLRRLPPAGRGPGRRAAARLGPDADAAGRLRLPAGARGKGFLERTSTPLRGGYIGNAYVFHRRRRSSLLVRKAHGSEFDVTDPIYDQAADAGLDDVATMQLIDINTWLPGDILVKADRMTMAHGLELRIPVPGPGGDGGGGPAGPGGEDRRGHHQVRAPRGHRANCCPRPPRNAPSWASRCRSATGSAATCTVSPSSWSARAQTDQWLDKGAALRLLRRFRADDPDVTWRQVWLLVVFSLWHQIYVERVLRPGGARLGNLMGPAAG